MHPITYAWVEKRSGHVLRCKPSIGPQINNSSKRPSPAQYHVAFQSDRGVNVISSGRKIHGGIGAGVINTGLDPRSIVARAVCIQTGAGHAGVIRQGPVVPDVRPAKPGDGAGGGEIVDGTGRGGEEK